MASRILWALVLSAALSLLGVAQTQHSTKAPKSDEAKARATEKRKEKREEKQQATGNHAVTCRDGTVDYPDNKTGACSHHGGVK